MPTGMPTEYPTTDTPTEMPHDAFSEIGTWTGIPTASPSAETDASMGAEDEAQAGLSDVAEAALAIVCTVAIVVVLLTLTWRLSDPRRGEHSLGVEAAPWDRGVRVTTNPVYDRSAVSPKASKAKLNRNRSTSTIREHYTSTTDVEETFDEPVSVADASSWV